LRSNKTLIIILFSLALQSGFAQNTEREVLVSLDSAVRFMQGNKDPGRALAYCNAVQKKARANDLWAKAKSFEISGLVYKNTNHQDSAILHFRQALYNFNIADTTDWFESYLVCRNMASIHQRYQLYDMAKTYYDSALYFISNHVIFNPEISRQDKDHHRRDLVLYFIGQNSAERGHIELALDQLRSIEQADTIKGSTRIRAMNYQGILYKNGGMYDSAKVKFQKIIESPMASKSYQAIAWHNLAGTFYDEGHTKEALKIIDKAIEVKSGLKSQRSLFISFLDKGEYLMQYGRPELAYQVFKKGLLLDLDVSRSRSLFVVYHYLDKVCGQLNKFDESDEWSERYFSASEAFNDERESLSLEDKRSNILASIQKFEMKLVSEKREVELNNRNDKNKVVAVVLLILAFSAFYWFYKEKKSRHKKGKKALSEDISSIVLSGIDPPEPEREEEEDNT